MIKTFPLWLTLDREVFRNKISIAAAKGIKIVTGANIYGYKDKDLGDFTLKNIELLIKKNLIQNKLIKPIYLS